MSEYDSLVWETNTLAKVAFVPLMKRFPQYESVADSDLLDTWDYLLTIAMTGVAANTRGILFDTKSIKRLKKALGHNLKNGSKVFDAYYKYTTMQSKEVGVSCSAVSAMWVALHFKEHDEANTDLRRCADQPNFINPISSFMNIAFGITEVGLPHFLKFMALEAEEKEGVDLGFGTKGTKHDRNMQIRILAEIFETFASKTVDTIGEEQEEEDRKSVV